jgi:Fe-S-cluster-containing dehydrogenase component
MRMDRRTLLKGIVTAGAAAGTSGGLAMASSVRRQVPADAVGLLYDATKCIGCKTCVVACREANGLPPERSADGLYDAPQDLSASTKNLIKLCRDGSEVSFMKAQCMHCVDPACAAACMLGALQKREFGIVSWDGSRCVGCRYCQTACPYNIPKFEWNATNPKIVKCELCRHLLAKGGTPACSRVCPAQAVIFGRRDELLAEAKRRIAAEPGRYVPRVYGEDDAGGTQCLYISHVPFEKLGLPELGPEPVPNMVRTVQHSVYKGFIAPVALYAVLGAVLLRNRRHPSEETEEAGS